MSRKAHGQIRRGQVITTYGPGALIDLPRHSAIVGGLDTWPKTSDLEEILEPRLTRKLQIHDGRCRAAALRAAARRERSPRARPRDRRLAVSGMVRRAGGQRQRGARAIAPAGSSQGARRQGTVRRPAGRGHSLRARLPEGARGRSRLAALRARRWKTPAGGSSGSTSAARAAIWPISSCAASAGSRAAFTRPRSSR